MIVLHISDLHFPTKLPLLSLRGKSLVGYANYSLRRKRLHPPALWNSLVSFLQKRKYDLLVLSGDITNVSHPLEFERARELLSPLLDSRTFMVPGNHDRYKPEATVPEPLFEKAFGDFLGENLSPNPSVYFRKKVVGGWVWIGWDSNRPLPIAKASGNVDPQVFPWTAKETSPGRYGLVCHHPLWNPGSHRESPGHRLKNRTEVADFLQKHPPAIYLHGHSHTHWFKEPGSQLPFPILNSASSTRVSDKKHSCGFHELVFEGQTIRSLKRWAFQSSQEIWTEEPALRFQESQGIV